MARPYSTRLVAMSLVVTRAFTARPRGLAARGLALRAGDAPDDKVLYALGVNVATQLSDIRKLFEGEEIPKIVEGINAYLSKEVMDPTPVLRENANEINALIQSRMAGALDAEKARGAAYTAEAAAVDGAEQTKSGLVIEHIKEGVGPAPTAASTVSVHYVGTLIDGTVFDSSRDRGEPAQFAVQQVIKGWQEALLLMQEGGTAKLTIPADIAYGDAGSGDKIPGGATICFEVELLKVLSAGVGGLIL
mmetsp:Transcript_24939/g.77802  ORF Transcript_24939/g.77802 Transcript_24939/m.77802 type:complete len:248 (+) Transcript_24939:128-871(+)